MSATVSLWDVAVVRYPCGCESHYRRRRNTGTFNYYDCAVVCKGGDDCGAKKGADIQGERKLIEETFAARNT